MGSKNFHLLFCKISALRKLLAIPLLAIYLFNIAGYQLLFSLAILHSDKLLVLRLDNNQYDNSELLEIKIPLKLPYYSSQTNYERLDGEANYQGSIYRYVKRKLANDTLYILCLKNEDKTQLKSARNDYAKKAHGLPAEKSSTAKKVNLLSEHQLHFAEISIVEPSQIPSQHGFLFDSPLYSSFSEGDFQPPDNLV